MYIMNENVFLSNSRKMDVIQEIRMFRPVGAQVKTSMLRELLKKRFRSMSLYNITSIIFTFVNTMCIYGTESSVYRCLTVFEAFYLWFTTMVSV